MSSQFTAHSIRLLALILFAVLLSRRSFGEETLRSSQYEDVTSAVSLQDAAAKVTQKTRKKILLLLKIEQPEGDIPSLYRVRVAGENVKVEFVLLDPERNVPPQDTPKAAPTEIGEEVPRFPGVRYFPSARKVRCTLQGKKTVEPEIQGRPVFCEPCVFKVNGYTLQLAVVIKVAWQFASDGNTVYEKNGQWREMGVSAAMSALPASFSRSSGIIFVGCASYEAGDGPENQEKLAHSRALAMSDAVPAGSFREKYAYSLGIFRDKDKPSGSEGKPVSAAQGRNFLPKSVAPSPGEPSGATEPKQLGGSFSHLESADQRRLIVVGVDVYPKNKPESDSVSLGIALEKALRIDNSLRKALEDNGVDVSSYSQIQDGRARLGNTEALFRINQNANPLTKEEEPAGNQPGKPGPP